MPIKTLTVAQGKAIQLDNIKNWARVLNPEVASMLVKIIEHREAKSLPPKTGYQVMRGCQIDEIVLNLVAGHTVESLTKD